MLIVKSRSGSAREATFAEAKSRWIVSVDLGQSIDPTAIAVLEVQTREAAHRRYWNAEPNITPDLIVPPKEWYGGTSGGLKYPKAPARIDVRHLERLSLRMPYPEQVAYVANLLRRPPLGDARPDLVCDQTGVGRPVVDLFRRGGLRPIGCTITAGAAETRDAEMPTDWRVAKLILVSRLQAALNERVLHIANALHDARALESEMHDFRGIFNDTGYARFGAREGAHDDIVLALALGVWWASLPMPTAEWGTYRM